MKDTKKDGKKIDEITDAVVNDAAMSSRIAIDAASAAANADKNDNNTDTWEIGKMARRLNAAAIIPMWSRIAIDAASAAANADKNDNNTDTWEIGKIITTGGIFKKGTAGYEAEKKKLLESLAEDGNPETQNMVEQISKKDEADKNDNKKKADEAKRVHKRTQQER